MEMSYPPLSTNGLISEDLHTVRFLTVNEVLQGTLNLPAHILQKVQKEIQRVSEEEEELGPVYHVGYQEQGIIRGDDALVGLTFFMDYVAQYSSEYWVLLPGANIWQSINEFDVSYEFVQFVSDIPSTDVVWILFFEVVEDTDILDALNVLEDAEERILRIIQCHIQTEV